MRRIILDLAVTLDGFIEGPNGEIDWCILDEDMDFDRFLAGIDAIFYGRKSYEMWGQFQPSQHADDTEKKLWREVHKRKKYVFSNQMRQGSEYTLVKGPDWAEQVRKIRSQEGADIWLYGGASLIKTFLDQDLVDVYRLAVHPIVLGSGKPLFESLSHPIRLQKYQTNVFRSGVVQLIYERPFTATEPKTKE